MKINSILVWLLIFSIIIVILNDLLLAEVPEIIPKGDALGVILSNLSLAYISSYIFYYVVVVVQEKKDSENLNKTITELNQRIVQNGRFAFQVLRQGAFGFTEEAKLYNWNSITREQIQTLCDRTNPQALSPNLGSRLGAFNQNETFGEVMYRTGVLQAERQIDTLFLFMKFLNTDHIKILNDLRNTDFFKSTGERFGVRGRDGNETMSVWAKSIYEYIQAVKELEDFNKQ